MDWLRFVQALVCDFDGTLAEARYDFAAMRARVATLAGEYGVGEEHLAGVHTLEGIAHAAALLGDRGPEFARRADALCVEIEMAGARKGRLLPEAVTALGRLRQSGRRIAVITRNCRPAVDLIVGGQQVGWQALLTREDVPLPKPHPDHALRALAAVGADAAGAVMVGDHPMDVETGRRAGLRTVGVLTGAGSREVLQAAGADLVLPDLTALAALLLEGDEYAPD